MDLPTLWYENEGGDRWIPPDGVLVGDVTRPDSNPPEGFIYQRARFPRSLAETIVRCEGGTSHLVMRGESGWPGDLVLALTRPTLAERTRAILRYGSPGPRFVMEQAILRAAGCERCINTLAHRVGLTWGYRRNGPEDKSLTRCEACKGTCEHPGYLTTKVGTEVCTRCGEFKPPPAGSETEGETT